MALFHLLAAGAAWANITLTLRAPEQPLEPGAVYTFIPEITGTASRQIQWTLEEGGSAVPFAELQQLMAVNEHGGVLVFHAPPGQTRRTYRLQVHLEVDDQAAGDILIQVEPRTARTVETKAEAVETKTPAGETKASAPSAAPAEGRYLWPLAGQPPRTQLQPSRIAWDRTRLPGALVVTDLGNPGPGAATRPVTRREQLLRLELDGGRKILATHGRLLGQHYPVQDGDARTAGFKFNQGCVAVRPDGGIVVADLGNSRIRLVKDGQVSTLAGNGTQVLQGDFDQAGQRRKANETAIFGPYGVAVTPGGEVVFSEYHSDRVRKIDRDGFIHTLATAEGPAPGAPALSSGPGYRAGLDRPSFLASGADGTIYCSDWNTVHAIRTDGGLEVLAGTGRTGDSPDQADARNARIRPGALAVTPEGNVIFCEPEGQRVRMVTPDHRLTTLAGTGAWLPDAHRGTPSPRLAAKVRLLNPQDLCLLPGGGLVLLDGNRNDQRLCFLGPGGKGEEELAARVEAVLKAIKDGNLKKVASFLAALDRWASYPKSPQETFQLSSLGRISHSVASSGLPGLPLDLQEQHLGAYEIAGERELGLAIRARVARAIIRRELARQGIHLPGGPRPEREAWLDGASGESKEESKGESKEDAKGL